MDKITATEQFFETIDFNDLDSGKERLKQYLKTGMIQHILHDMLNKNHQNPLFEPETYSEGHLQLVQTDHYLMNIHLEQYTGNPIVDPRIRSDTSDIIAANLGPGTITYEYYHTPDNFDPEVFNPSIKLTKGQVLEVKPYDVFAIKNQQDAVRVSSVTDSCLQIALISNPKCNQSTFFDSQTLMPIYNTSASIASSRVNYCLDFLGTIGQDKNQCNEASIKTLLDYTQHPDHFVRWEAIRNLFKLSRSAAIDALKSMQHDPHPHIRESATSFLSSYTEQ